MHPNLSCLSPPLPTSFVQPPPLPRKFYVITVGEEVGILEDVKLLAEIRLASEERFSVNVFHDWDRAVAYYKSEYDTGRVALTSRLVFTSHRHLLDESDLDESDHIDPPIGPPRDDTLSKSGLFVRNDSFSRMGTQTVGATAPQPSRAATRVRTCPENGAPPTSHRDEATYVYSSSDEEDVYGTSLPPVKRPVPFPSTPFPRAAMAPEIAITHATAVASSGPTSTNANLSNPPQATTTTPSVPAVPSIDEDSGNPAPKRKYIKVYLPDGVESFDSAIFERALRSLGTMEPTSGPSKPSKSRKLQHDGPFIADGRSTPVARASLPLIARLMDYVGLTPPITRHSRIDSPDLAPPFVASNVSDNTRM